MIETLHIMLGITTGIITAVLLYIFNQIFKKLLLPWYQNFKYKGVDLNGKWTGFMIDTPEVSFPFNIKLDQNAHDINGTAELNKSQTRDKYSMTKYDVSGYVWEGYITLNFQSSDRTRLSFATALLQVLKGGRRLEGFFVFRDLRHDGIRERPVYFDRSD